MKVQQVNNVKAIDNKVFIVLLNYNGSQDTIECIESLLKLDYVNYQIIIVDNSESLEPLQSLIDWANLQTFSFRQCSETDINLKIQLDKVVFVKASQNNGFAAGNNIALKAILKTNEANSFVWILNNDTVVDSKSLKTQVRFMHHNSENKIGILGSKLIYYFNPSILQAVGGKFDTRFYISKHIGEGEIATKEKVNFEPIDYVIGASMLVPYSFLKEVGLLSEEFFLYYEELDWSNRAKKKGWKIDWCEESIVFHKEGSSIGSSYNADKKSYQSEIYVFKSRKVFVKKYYGLNFTFYASSLLLILNRIRKGKIKLGYELITITFGR